MVQAGSEVEIDLVRLADRPPQRRSDPAALGRVRRPLWTKASCSAGLVAVVAVLVRIPAVSFGLPLVVHPDEPTNVSVAAGMIDHNSWNPHFWSYPSLLFDVMAAVGHLQRAFGTWAPHAGLSAQNLGIASTTDPHLFIALRAVTIAVSVAACLAVWWFAYLVTRRVWIAGLGGLCLAVSPMMATNGVYITPDTYSALFTAMALVGAVLILRRRGMPAYLIAGAAVGLAVGSKYNAVMVAVPVVVAHLLRYSLVGQDPSDTRWSWPSRLARDARLLSVAGVAAVAVFVVTTPSAITNTHGLLTQATVQAELYSHGTSGMVGSSFRFYIHDFANQGSIYCLLGLVGIAGAVGRWWREWIIAASLVVSYVALISAQAVHYDRDLMIAMVAVVSASAIGLATAYDALRKLLPPRPWAATATTVASVGIIGGLLSPVTALANLSHTLSQPARAQAQAWIDKNVPSGSTIVVDPYGPWLDPGRYHLDELPFVLVVPISKIPPSAPVVITEQGSGRFLHDFPAQEAEYRQLVARSCRVVNFTDGSWIRVLMPCSMEDS